MSVDLGKFVNRIPKDKLIELANVITAETTEQQAMEALNAAGVEASAEEVQALLASLAAAGEKPRVISDEQLDMVDGGYDEELSYCGQCSWCNQ